MILCEPYQELWTTENLNFNYSGGLGMTQEEFFWSIGKNVKTIGYDVNA